MALPLAQSSMAARPDLKLMRRLFNRNSTEGNPVNQKLQLNERKMTPLKFSQEFLEANQPAHRSRLLSKIRISAVKITATLQKHFAPHMPITPTKRSMAIGIIAEAGEAQHAKRQRA